MKVGEKNTPGGSRTPNLLIRSQMLYPVKLRALIIMQIYEYFSNRDLFIYYL